MIIATLFLWVIELSENGWKRMEGVKDRGVRRMGHGSRVVFEVEVTPPPPPRDAFLLELFFFIKTIPQYRSTFVFRFPNATESVIRDQFLNNDLDKYSINSRCDLRIFPFLLLFMFPIKKYCSRSLEQSYCLRLSAKHDPPFPMLRVTPE